MKRLPKQFGILSALLDALIRKPETVAYPHGPLSMPENYRGVIVMADPDQCSGCGLCVRDCPAQALVLEKTSRNEFRLSYYPARCAYCGQCEDNCRRGAISHTNALVGPSSNPNKSIILKETNDDPN